MLDGSSQLLVHHSAPRVRFHRPTLFGEKRTSVGGAPCAFKSSSPPTSAGPHVDPDLRPDVRAIFPRGAHHHAARTPTSSRTRTDANARVGRLPAVPKRSAAPRGTPGDITALQIIERRFMRGSCTASKGSSCTACCSWTRRRAAATRPQRVLDTQNCARRADTTPPPTLAQVIDRGGLGAHSQRQQEGRAATARRWAGAVRNIALVVRSVHQPASLVGRSRVETLFLLLIASPRARAWRRRRREVAQVRHLVCVPPACDFYSGVSLL